jgi:hypothetical protein
MIATVNVLWLKGCDAGSAAAATRRVGEQVRGATLAATAESGELAGGCGPRRNAGGPAVVDSPRRSRVALVLLTDEEPPRQEELPRVAVATLDPCNGI